MKSIAFDLDGVLCPDYDSKTDRFNNLDSWIGARSRWIMPMFTMGENVHMTFITGRPVEDLVYTQAWIDRHFKKSGYDLYHDCQNFGAAAQYKAAVLNNNTEIQLFIESDPEQVAFLKENVTTGCHITHFEELIRRSITLELISSQLARMVNA